MVNDEKREGTWFGVCLLEMGNVATCFYAARDDASQGITNTSKVRCENGL